MICAPLNQSTSQLASVSTNDAAPPAQPSGIDGLLSCPLCMERYSSNRLVPKLLPCHHSFCVACLDKLTPDNEQYQCPTCRKAFEKPQSGCMSDMQTNFYIVAILDCRNSPALSRAAEPITTSSSSTAAAGGSSNINDVTSGQGCQLHNKPLTFYCSTCTLFICNQCILDHNKAKNHSIEDLEHFMENCKDALAERSAVAHAAQEARQQYIKTLKAELESSSARETELAAAMEHLFREIYVRLGEIRRKIDDEATVNATRISHRLKSEIVKMEAEAERLDTVRRLCDDVRGRNDLRTLSAVYSSQDLVDVVNNLSNPIITVPRVVITANDQPLRELLDLVQNFMHDDQQCASLFSCSEVKRPVIVLPKPSNTEQVGNDTGKASESDAELNLSSIAEVASEQADQAVPMQNVIEVDNVAVRLREKPTRRVVNSQHVEEALKRRSTTQENLQMQIQNQQRELNYAKSRAHYRRSLVELRANVTSVQMRQPGEDCLSKNTRHQVISYHPSQPDMIVPSNHQSKSSSTYLLSASAHHVGATIASNSSSGASSAADGSSGSDGLAKLSPPLQILDSAGAANGKAPFIFEFDDVDSADGTDEDSHRRSGNSASGRHRRTQSTSKLNNKARGVPLGVISPQKVGGAKDKTKKFSLGRAISELFNKDKKSSAAIEVCRRGEEKVSLRAVPVSGGNASNTVTSSDSGGDHHSMGSGPDGRLLTPAQMRCVSLESMAMAQSSKPSSGQQSISPTTAITHGPMITSPQPVRVATNVSDVLPTSEHRRFSGDFSKRFNLNSKSKVTGGPQASTPSSKTRSYYQAPRREESMPVMFPSQKQENGNMVSTKPPAFQAVPASAPTKPRHPQQTAKLSQGTELVNALLVASASASSSHIQFNATPSAISRSNNIVANWNTTPSFCQAPVVKFGRQGSAPGAFDWPESIVLSPGGSDLYVGDFKNHRIQAFTTAGDYLYEFSVRDGMVDYYPGHMAIDPRGDRIIFPWLEKEGSGYIANSLVAFTRDGRFLTKYSHREFGCPRSVAINSRSEMFVADQQKGCIFVFDREGRRLRTIGKRGTDAPGEFNHPCHVALGRNGEVIVADQNNNRIQVFDTRGGICEVLTHRFTRPCYTAIDSFGSLMVADGSNKISILSLNTAVPSRSPVIGVVESSDDRLRGPRGLAVDNRGGLFVCDVGNFCVKKYDYADLLPQRL